MSLEDKLLVVVDPTTDANPAIDRVVNLLQQGVHDTKPEITLLFIVDSSSADTSADNPAIYKDDDYLFKLITPLRDLSISPSVRISWSSEWADSVLFSATEVNATTILFSHPGEKASRSMSDEFWKLIRNSTVPVGVIQTSNKPKRKNILVAIDLQDKELIGLNRRLFEAGKSIAKVYGAELHLAHAYGSSSTYPDRGKIVALTGLPNQNIHLRAGEPDEALALVAKELSPDLVLIGASRRTGIKAALRGHKIGKILRKVPQDIFVIV